MTMLRTSVALVVFLSAPGLLHAQCTGCPAASFGPAAPDFNLGGDPRMLSTADFNGDGFLDIVAGHGGGSGTLGGITILLGLPGGRFGPPVSPGSVFRAQSLAVADFNGDARSDIAFFGDTGLGIFFGRGDGTFAPSAMYPTGPFGINLTVGDLDGDARADLVVSSHGGFSVLLNRGDGRFAPPRVSNNSTSGSFPLLADFNEDGKLDFLADSFSGGQLFLGNGDGTFSSTPLLAPVSGVKLAADFDRDGHLDIARVEAELDVSYGNGDGTFDSPISIAPISASDLASADFDRDGWPDLIATAHPGRVDLFLSDGIGGFESVRSLALGQTVTVTAADFDRDGVPDAAVGYSLSPMLTLLRGDSDGSLLTAPSLPVIARALATADFNGDAKTDLAAGGNGVSVWTNDGSGQFLPAYTDGSPVGVQAVGAGDLNGDGKADFVSAEEIGFFPQTGTLRVFLGDGAASFIPLAAQNLDFAPNDLGVGNLDGSGGLDLVLTTNTGVHVLFGQGDGTFTVGPILDAARFYQRLVLRDFDGDAALDIAATSSYVSVWLGNGSGAFSAPTEYIVATPYEIAAGDFNGDGELDLLTGTLYSSVGYSLLRGRGDGTFEPSFSFPLNFATFGLSALDFDSDGTLDLAVSDYYGDLLLARGSGKGTFTASNRYAIGGPSGRSIVSDWNGDGKPELAVTGGSGVAILLNTNCTPRRLGVMVQSATCAGPSALFSPQPAVSAMDDGGNVVSCAGGSVTASLVPGTGSAGAVLGGTTTKPLMSGTAAFTNLSINLPGPRYELQFQHSVAGVVRSRPISVHAPYAVGITGPPAACSATLADFSADAGFDGYLWLVDGVERGAGRSFSPFGLPPGPHTIEVRATKDGCSATASRPVTSSPGGLACALSFFTLPPCRLADTRATEGPALASGIDRVFPTTIGNCGIPPTAKAISANVTITEPTIVGHLSLFPAGGAFPATSVLNFSAGQTRANNAVLTLGLGRDITARCTQQFGSAHLILDVNGYFE